MPKPDDMMRNYKSLDEQRREREKKLTSFNTRDVQLGFAAVVLFMMAITDFSRSYALAFLVVISIFIGRIIWRYKKRLNTNSNAVPFFDVKPKRSDDSRQTEYSAQEYQTIVQSRDNSASSYDSSEYTISCDKYDNIVDSWDIKDKKPPWEL